jgi:hypothetical protein
MAIISFWIIYAAGWKLKMLLRWLRLALIPCPSSNDNYCDRVS